MEAASFKTVEFSSFIGAGQLRNSSLAAGHHYERANLIPPAWAMRRPRNQFSPGTSVS